MPLGFIISMMPIALMMGLLLFVMYRNLTWHTSLRVAIGSSGITLKRNSKIEHIPWTDISYVDMAVSTRRVKGWRHETFIRLELPRQYSLVEKRRTWAFAFHQQPNDTSPPYSDTILAASSIKLNPDFVPALVLDKGIERFAGNRRIEAARWYKFKAYGELESVTSVVDTAKFPE
jgi:hypothetical protein